MGDVILGCAAFTRTWVSTSNFFLMLLQRTCVTNNPSWHQLSLQWARSLAHPSLHILFFLNFRAHFNYVPKCSTQVVVLATSSVHLVCQPGALYSSPAVFWTCHLMPCCPPEAQVRRLLWQSWIYPEPEGAEPFLLSWVEACCLQGWEGRQRLCSHCALTCLAQWKHVGGETVSLSLALNKELIQQNNQIPFQA